MRQGRTARNAHLRGSAARPARRAARPGKGSDMAEEQSTTAEVGEMSETEEPDYKALYEAEKAHSRKWEKQAKANKGAASALDEANEAKKSADEKIAELEKRLDAKEKAEARARTAAKVAQEKGVPADLIVGDDEESMAEWADKMLAAFKKKPAPQVEKPGSFDKGGKGSDEALRDFAKRLLK